MTGGEQKAIEAIARHFSATWESGSGEWPGAVLRTRGRRIAVAVATIGPCKPAGGERPRLRFDRVVVQVIGRLQSALSGLVPHGRAVMITITAPIRLPGQTADALVETVRARLARRPARMEIDVTLHGNGIRASLATGVAEQLPRVVVFVHNPDPEADIPAVLFRFTRALLQSVSGAAAEVGPKGFSGDRWLALALGDGALPPGALRRVLPQFGLATGFVRTLLVSGGGRVEALPG